MSGVADDDPAANQDEVPLDPLTSPELAELMTLIATALDVPQAWVAIAARDRGWFKSDFGLDTEPPGPAEASDMATPRFSARATLRGGDGRRLGTLCAADARPPSGERVEQLLPLFAKQVVRLLESRQDRLQAATRAEKRREFQAQQDAELATSKASLQDRELRLNALLDAMAEGVVVQDERGVVIGSNVAARRILSLTDAELGGQSAHGAPLAPLVHRDGSPMPDDERPAAQVLRTGQSVTDRVMGLRTTQERTLWLSTNATPLRAKPNAPLLGVVLTLRDITQQVLLQEALERSLLQYRSLISSLPVGVAVSHGKTMRFVNQALANILGYESPSELEGRETLSVVDPASVPTILERYAGMARGEFPAPGVLQCRKRDGSSVLVEVTSMPSIYEDKPAILALLRDVTESARARQAQERSEARFRALVSFAPVGIFETDLQGRCIYANERAAAIMGLSVAEALDLGWLRAVHPDDLPGIHAKRAEALAAETGLMQERRFVTPGGVVHTQVQTVPLLSEGRTTGYLGALVDLTELRAAHAALVDSLSQKETLLKEIHHRVKNNLQVIASLLRIGRGYVKDAPSLSVFNDSIARVHSIALIHERLYRSQDLGRIDMGDYLRGLLAELVRANSTEQRISSQVLASRLFFDIDHCVPIGLIVGELVSNALKHAFAAGTTASPALVIALTAEADGYELVVRDNGSGIDPSRTREDSLGLRLVASLVKQLGGRHRVESQAGTAWHIVFPGVRERDS